MQLDVLPRNPLVGLGLVRPAQSDLHRPYTPAQRALVQAEAERRGETQLLLFVSLIYYCAIWCGEELRGLRLKDVLADSIRMAGARARNRKSEPIALPRQVRELLAPLHLADLPPDHFLFSRSGRPGPDGVGRAFMPRRLEKVLQAVGLAGQQHTLCSFKHTGIISLYLATKDGERVRRYCRHAHAGITATYLRGLGALHDGERLDLMPDF